MQKRYGKFLADWRDAAGTRHRKAFDTIKEANDFAQHMRTLAHREAHSIAQGALPNPSARRPPSRKPPRSGPARKLTIRTPKPRSPR
ncbi:MAG TPA: hypothetical protein VFA89_05865 [Terriglobales bacterium]|nr:hypothetical protein [Terriglobales bacterium]